MITNFKRNTSDGLRYFERDGAIYWELYFQCPVCLQMGIVDTPLSYWSHASCTPPDGQSNKIFIGDNGKYICEYCEHSEVIVLWGYYCPKHQDKKDPTPRYIKCENVKVLSKAISIAGMMVEDAGAGWLIKVLTEIKTQFEDPRYN
jgi:hypothetical protein